MDNLHCHSVFSDGKLTYQENLEIAEQLGIKNIAFTDHDSLPNMETMNKMKSLNTPISWMTGIEISAVLLKELEGTELGMFHILGLFVDPMNEKLRDFCKKAQAGRIERMKRMVGNLQTLGFEISVDDCLSVSGGETVGRPHIVTALKNKVKNLEVIESLRLKMEKASKGDETIKKRYEDMMARGESQYSYDLFLTDEAFIPNIYTHYLDPISMDEAVTLIRDAGGVAILAHYYSVQKHITPALLETLIATNRLDGLEQVCGLFAYGGPLEEKVKQSRIVTKNIIEKYGCLETGGMDSHNIEDWRQFAQTEWFSKETEGMVDRMLATKKIKLTKDNCNFSR